MPCIDIDSIEPSYPSLCIPRAFVSVSREQVFTTFKQLKFGHIRRVDMIQKTSATGQNFQRIFIHFNQWYTNPQSVNSRISVLNGNELKIVYDEPWFWKVSMLRTQQSNQPQQEYSMQKHDGPLHTNPNPTFLSGPNKDLSILTRPTKFLVPQHIDCGIYDVAYDVSSDIEDSIDYNQDDMEEILL
jgi:hypothetical protein